MKIVGIDASTKRTALALHEDGKLIEYRLIDYSREKDLDKRMRSMCADIHTVLEYFDPDLILCEDVWISANPNTAKILARLGGAIYMWAVIHTVDFQYIIPAAWRRKVGIYLGKKVRSELKGLAIEKVQKDYGVTCSDDEAEAILIGASGFIQDDLFE